MPKEPRMFIDRPVELDDINLENPTPALNLINPPSNSSGTSIHPFWKYLFYLLLAGLVGISGIAIYLEVVDSEKMINEFVNEKIEVFVPSGE